MPANSSAADPRHALPATAYRLHCAARAVLTNAGSTRAVPTLPITLEQLQETLDLLGVSIQRMAHAVADSCDEDDQSIDEDAAPPEARALRWHLETTADTLGDARKACSASGQWSRRLFAEAPDAGTGTAPPAPHGGVAGRSTCASAACGEHTGASSGMGAAETIVIGYDGSPPSERALERAASLVATGGKVVVVTASPTLGPAGVVSERILDSPARDELGAILRRGRALLQQWGTDPTLVPTDSDPAEALIQAARDEGADLILVGHTGSAYVTRALLGSTATNVLRHAPRDVLVVR